MRRSMLIFSLIFIVVALMGCDNSNKKLKLTQPLPPDKDLKVFITSDTHFLSKSLTDNGAAFARFMASGDGKELGYSEEIFAAFMNDINKQKPDIVILSGDITNNGEKRSHLDIAERLAAIEKSGSAVFVIPGNHDIANPWAREFKGDKQYLTDTIQAKDFSEIYKQFGYEEALSRDKTTLSYLASPSERLWFLMLDTSQYKSNKKLGRPQVDGQISESTMEWIKRCKELAQLHGAVVIPVMHHNLLNHSKVIHEGFTLNNSEEVLNQFEGYGIPVSFSGHIHIQDISTHTAAGKPLIYDVASNALSVYPHQYGLIRYSTIKQTLDYDTSLLPVEQWAVQSGSKDMNLIHFNRYSQENFGKLGYQMGYNRMTTDVQYEEYSEEEIQAMADVMRILNLNYFAGREWESAKEVVNSDGYKLWQNAPASFLKNYVESMLEDTGDDNHLHLQLAPMKP